MTEMTKSAQFVLHELITKSPEDLFEELNHVMCDVWRDTLEFVNSTAKFTEAERAVQMLKHLYGIQWVSQQYNRIQGLSDHDATYYRKIRDVEVASPLV